MIRNLPNIEPSGFHNGQYVGYAAGRVYTIQRSAGQWRAIPKPFVSSSITRTTLAQLSVALENVMPSQFENSAESPESGLLSNLPD